MKDEADFDGLVIRQVEKVAIVGLHERLLQQVADVVLILHAPLTSSHRPRSFLLLKYF